MSDDNAPKLRLKPRLSGEAPASNPPAEANPPVNPESATSPAAPAEAPKVRAKPRLGSAPAEQVAATGSAAPLPAAAEAVSEPPPPAPAPPPPEPPAPPPAASATEAGKSKFSLKPKSAPAEPPPASIGAGLPPAPPPPPEAVAAPPSLAVDPQPPAPPMEPVTDTADSPAEVTIMKRASGAPFQAPGGKPPPPPANAPFPPPPPAKPAGKSADHAYTKKVKKLALVAGGVVGFLVLTIGGFMVFRMLTKKEAPPAVAAKPAVTSEANPADPAAAPDANQPADATAQNAATGGESGDNKPQSTAGQAVAAAKDAVAKVEQGRTADANEVIASDAAPAKPDETKPAATTETEQKPAMAAETRPAAVTPKPAVQAPAPSAAFKSWVADLKNVSVRVGPPARVFIGGITYPQGEVVNPQLGIVFEGYDDTRKMIIFRDRTGARVERRR